MRLDDLAEINPPTQVKKGAIAPFIDMSSLPQHSRDIAEVGAREFKGSGARFQNGDTLIARITPCLENGKGAMVNCLPAGIGGFGSTEFIVARAKATADARFVYYVTRSEAFRDVAISRMEGTSGRQRVSWQQIASIEVPDLSPPERKEIGEILGSLDDKIELNRRMAATLEEMARSLYRSWFVNFDPVHAKAAGHPPAHMDAATAALFPDRFGDDGLPEGWRMGPVSDLFDILMGQSPPGDTYNDEGLGLPFFQGRTDFGFRFPTRRKFCSAPTRIAARDTVLLSVRAPVGDLNRAWEECCIGRGVASLAEKNGYNAYGYEALWSLSEELKAYDGEGTVFGSINRKQLADLSLALPPQPLRESFQNAVGSMDDRIRNIESQNQTLATLRDSLLPRLMSGELRVGAARAQVEEVA